MPDLRQFAKAIAPTTLALGYNLIHLLFTGDFDAIAGEVQVGALLTSVIVYFVPNARAKTA